MRPQSLMRMISVGSKLKANRITFFSKANRITDCFPFEVLFF